MTHVVRVLAEVGAVTRARDSKDARKINLRLTKKARNAVDALIDQARTVEEIAS